MTKWIPVVLALALLAFAPGCDRERQALKTDILDFTLNDVKTGKPVKLSDYRGKIVMLEFWATWCPPCRMAIPELDELQKNHAGEDFVLLSISIDEDISNVKTFLEEYEVSFPVLFDDQGVNSDFGSYSIPATFVIDRDGKVVRRHMGYAPGALEELYQEVMAEEKPKEAKGAK